MVLGRLGALAGMAALTLALCSCAGVKPLTAERPRDEAFRTEIKREISTINVPIEASTEDLAKVLNQTVGTEIYKGSAKYRGLTADVLRNGPMTLNAADNYLYLTVPIAMTLGYGMLETPAISFKLKFRLNAKVSTDWKLNVEIYYMGLSDLLADETRIGPISIKPRGIVEGITQPVQKALSDAASKVVNEKFPVKAEIAKAWTATQKPVLLDKTYNAWLTLTPREAVLCPLYAQNNRVRISVGLTSFAELVVGPEPAPRPPVPLPNLKLANGINRNFRITLNTDLHYRDILAIATPLLLNREFADADGKKIILKDLDVYGNGDRLVVKVQTTGSLDGVFYLTCRPRFDPKTDRFFVEDLDFDLQTRSLLLQSANWFLHGTIRGIIQDRLNMDLTERVEQSREIVRKAAAQVKLADHLVMKGKVNALKFGDILVQKDKISLQVYAEGETAIFFQ